MLPVAWVLLVSSLGLPHRAYTGIALQPDGRVGSVDPGSTGDVAGLAAGDRLVVPSDGGTGEPLTVGPLAGAEPGVPLVVELHRDGERVPVWLVPRALPETERRFLALQ